MFVRIRKTVVGASFATVLCGLSALASIPASAADRPVDPSCRVTDRAHTYSSVQAAVSSARAGDWLIVRGTCVGATTIDRNLSIIGLSERRSIATLDGGQGGPVLTIQDGVQVTLALLKITNGSGHFDPVAGQTIGGGIYDDGGTVTVIGSQIVGNTSATSGGGIFAIRNTPTGGIVTLVSSQVTQNTSRYGGGIYVTSGSIILAGSSTVSQNTAWFGGGVYSDGGSVRAADGTISTDPISQIRLPAWTGRVAGNISNGGQAPGPGAPPNGPDCFGGGSFSITCG